MCLFDQPEVFGKVNRRTDTSGTVAASVFEEFRKDTDGSIIAVKAMERLLRATSARWVILSYSSGGRATAEELNQALCRNGRLVEVVEVDYKRNVMVAMNWTNEWLAMSGKPTGSFCFIWKNERPYCCRRIMLPKGSPLHSFFSGVSSSSLARLIPGSSNGVGSGFFGVPEMSVMRRTLRLAIRLPLALAPLIR